MAKLSRYPIWNTIAAGYCSWTAVLDFSWWTSHSVRWVLHSWSTLFVLRWSKLRLFCSTWCRLLQWCIPDSMTAYRIVSWWELQTCLWCLWSCSPLNSKISTLPDQFCHIIRWNQHLQNIILPIFLVRVVVVSDGQQQNWIKRVLLMMAWTSSSLPTITHMSSSLLRSLLCYYLNLMLQRV